MKTSPVMYQKTVNYFFKYMLNSTPDVILQHTWLVGKTREAKYWRFRETAHPICTTLSCRLVAHLHIWCIKKITMKMCILFGYTKNITVQYPAQNLPSSAVSCFCARDTCPLHSGRGWIQTLVLLSVAKGQRKVSGKLNHQAFYYKEIFPDKHAYMYITKTYIRG